MSVPAGMAVYAVPVLAASPTYSFATSNAEFGIVPGGGSTTLAKSGYDVFVDSGVDKPNPGVDLLAAFSPVDAASAAAAAHQHQRLLGEHGHVCNVTCGHVWSRVVTCGHACRVMWGQKHVVVRGQEKQQQMQHTLRNQIQETTLLGQLITCVDTWDHVYIVMYRHVYIVMHGHVRTVIHGHVYSVLGSRVHSHISRDHR
eukprot:551538-Rhodomonas_salina.2